MLLFITLLIPLLVGMGSGAPGDIPKTPKNFSVTYIDQSDISTDCTEASIAGKIFLEGKKGEGTYTVSFENIKSVIFLSKNGFLTGSIKMKDGGYVEIIINKDQKAYGRTKYGSFQIKLIDLKKMIFP